MLRQRLGAEVERLERVDLGVINAVYAARLSNGLGCFVKIAPASRGEHRLRHEVWAFERCRRIGIPTPEVLEFVAEPGAFPEPFHITRRVPGENGAHLRLTDAQRYAVFRQIGGYLARIHSIRMDGFGLLQGRGDGFAGEWSKLRGRRSLGSSIWRT